MDASWVAGWPPEGVGPDLGHREQGQEADGQADGDDGVGAGVEAGVDEGEPEALEVMSWVHKL